MKQWSQWLVTALLFDAAWVYPLFLLRKTKWFIPAWVLGMLIASSGVLFGLYMLIALVSLSQTPGEAGLGGVGALMGFILSLPFALLLLLYRRAYQRYREEKPRNPTE